MSKTVALLGANGAQASGVLRGLGRSAESLTLVCCDRAFPDASAISSGEHKIELREFDLVAQPEVLAATLKDADLVINVTGPYFKLGPIILDAAIAAGTDYVDICDDGDATELLLERNDAAIKAGVTALVGMGSAPGTTNVLVRLALDALPDDEATVRITWCVDTDDMVGAVVPHFIHSFRTAIPGRETTPDWDDLDPHWVEFPEPVGKQFVVNLSHPEVSTLPRFTRATSVVNSGGLIPDEFTHLGWILSRLPDSENKNHVIQDVFERVRQQHADRETVGSGLLVDVRVGDEGIIFMSGGKMSQDDATGTPAAAGALICLAGLVPGPGVVSPEVLSPRDFFSYLRQVSAGGGGMTAYRSHKGRVLEPVRIRDLLDIEASLQTTRA